jgi:predicted nucleic acid-binding protein
LIAPDSSVLVAALAPWHEAHAVARHALAGTRPSLIAHVAFETTSALSRMPEGRRVSPAVVLEALSGLCRSRWLTLDGAEACAALERAIGCGLRGGALYDALIAATAARHGARLLSADRRARRTYEALEVDAVLIAAAHP